ncbi:MAG: putative manganese-dependent inorganic diphosphatase [Actinomycetota bacterium]|nr:putative manganese-dependent inorganic diphosphatase [Actinomycetota bacterium]
MADDVRVTQTHEIVKRRRIYVTGHRNPDLDSIASAIGYAELKRRVDSGNEYVAVRLGELNAQTEWALERSGAARPELMNHVYLRVRDVMRESFPVARDDEPVRSVGLTMARENLDIVPIVDADGRLIGVMTERALAHRYIRESRTTSTLVDAPTTVAKIVEVLDGELVGGSDRQIEGRVWVHSIDPRHSESKISEGDVVVVGNRDDAQRQALELGAALLVASNGVEPTAEIMKLAADRDASVVVSPLDSYVSSRMITLAAPCRALADTEPLTVDPDDLVSEISDEIKDVHYRAAVAVDRAGKPCGLITRSDLVSPRLRRVLLVDHAEQAQSVPGVEQAEIVEILDHHHIGSIETKVPVTATFDPVGSTATLVAERFRQNGMEPGGPAAGMLLAAVLSDTVLLNSPTTTDRDRVVVEFLERALGVDAMEFGSEMFEAGSDVTDVPAEDIVSRDAKQYTLAGGETIAIAQIEVVGKAVLERGDELRAALESMRSDEGHVLTALMVTDILSKGTDLLVAGDAGPVERAFGKQIENGSLPLPSVMSRKKQVAPKLLGAFGD